MLVRDILAGFIFTVLLATAWADETKDGPRTGYFRKNMTTVELLGADGASHTTICLKKRT